MTYEDIVDVIHSMQGNKNPWLDGWKIDFCFSLLEVIGKYLLIVVEKSRIKGRVLEDFNSTFISLILKVEKE